MSTTDLLMELLHREAVLATLFALFLFALAALIVHLVTAPRGWEDEEGFHESPFPGTDAWAREQTAYNRGYLAGRADERFVAQVDAGLGTVPPKEAA